MSINLDKAKLRNALDIPGAFDTRINYHLSEHFISPTRDFLTLYELQPPTIVKGSAAFDVAVWSMTFRDVPAKGSAYLYWDLPEEAKEIYVQWAWENVNDACDLEMRLYNASFSNYLGVRQDTGATAADHKVFKNISASETVISTEAVDLYCGSPIEYGFWFSKNPNFGTGGLFHSHRGRGDFRNALATDELIHRCRLFNEPNVTSGQLDTIKRVMFYAYNDHASNAYDISPLQVHFDTRTPFIIAYSTTQIAVT